MNSSNSRDELKWKLQKKLQTMDDTHKKQQQEDAKKLQEKIVGGTVDATKQAAANDFSYTAFTSGVGHSKSSSGKWVSVKKGEKHKLLEKNIRWEERKWIKFEKINDVDEKVHAINKDRFNKALLKSGGVKTHDNVGKLKKAKKSLEKKKEKSREKWNDRNRAQTQSEEQKNERRSNAGKGRKGKGKA